MLPPLAQSTSTTPISEPHHTRRHRQGEFFGELRFPSLNSRRALHDFRVADGLGDNDTWDETTQGGVRDRQCAASTNRVCTERAGPRL